MCREKGGSLFMGLGLGFRRVQEEVEDKKHLCGWVLEMKAGIELWHKFAGLWKCQAQVQRFGKWSKEGRETGLERVVNFCNPRENPTKFMQNFAGCEDPEKFCRGCEIPVKFRRNLCENPTNFCMGCEIPGKLHRLQKSYEISQPLQNLLAFWKIFYCKILDLHNFPYLRKIANPCKN